MEIKFDNDEKIEEFLEESNAIEREYSAEALQDAKEAWNYTYKYRKNIVTVEYILEIHRLLLQRLEPEIAGKIRDCAVYIGGSKKEKKPEKELLQELQDWINSCNPQGKKVTETEIKNWHIAFEGIHPFQDGNGRTGRILWQIQRITNNFPIKIIHEGAEQQSYYRWFK